MYTNNFVQVGANIQNCLLVKHMSQQQLADVLGVSKQVMSKIVNGSKAINVNELTRISNALGVTADELLSMPVESNQSDSVSFMGNINDEETRKNVDLLQAAIDEIIMLEDLLND
ncbi:MAG: helix-turn-helix domain-containing protein [Clostridiales bacterium]|nr:helix-turn-helix domain-containing protein [Clostridiales bacterium]